MSEICHLNFKKYGEKGRVIVILHGLFGMLDNWNTLAKHLAENYQVYILDQRNHGKSCHTSKMSYDLMMEDLLLFLNEQNLDQINLVGHSMGGKVAMNFALKYPNYLERLIVVDIAPKEYEPAHHLIFSALESIDFSQNPTRSELALKMSEKIKQPAIIHFLMKNIGRNTQRELQWKMNWKVIQQFYDEMNTWSMMDLQFFGEVLFIKGERSNYIQEEDKATIQHYYPKAKILTIEKAGHWVHAEQPAILKDAFRKFIY